MLIRTCCTNKPLKIEVGKTYLDKSSREVSIIHNHNGVFIGLLQNNSSYPFSYNGYGIGVISDDLISEVTPPISYDVYVNVYPSADKQANANFYRTASDAIINRGPSGIETRHLRYTQGIGFTDMGAV